MYPSTRPGEQKSSSHHCIQWLCPPSWARSRSYPWTGVAGRNTPSQPAIAGIEAVMMRLSQFHSNGLLSPRQSMLLGFRGQARYNSVYQTELRAQNDPAEWSLQQQTKINPIILPCWLTSLPIILIITFRVIESAFISILPPAFRVDWAGPSH